MKKEKKVNNHVLEVMTKALDSIKEEIHINSSHEYNYVKSDFKECTLHTLYYSNGEQWADHIKGTVAVAIIDNGNGVTIENLLIDEEISYLKLEQLHILLRLQCENTTFQKLKPNLKINF
jgi:hypothetical protein